MKTITQEQLDAGLEKAGVPLEQLKAEFALLFPDATRILKTQGHHMVKDASYVWLGFKAGVMIGVDLKEKENKSRSSPGEGPVTDDRVTPHMCYLGVAPEQRGESGNCDGRDSLGDIDPMVKCQDFDEGTKTCVWPGWSDMKK